MKLYRYFAETYYCAAFFVYSASFLAFFWELRSLLLRFPLLEILGYLSYQLAFALAESLIVSIFVVVLVSILPIRQVRNNRTVVGGLFVLSFAVSSIIFKGRLTIVEWLTSSLSLEDFSAFQITLFLWLFTALGLPVIAIQLVRVEKLTDRVKTFIENLSVLAVLYTALGLIGVLIVIYRNLS